MKKLLHKFIYFLVLVVVGFLSCEKIDEQVIPIPPFTPANKPPIANAGPDQTIFLPIDSVVLDATASIDNDGTIIFYRWSKLAGPESYIILDSISAKTVVKNLVNGIYRFEVTITDNKGSIAKDVVEIIVFRATITSCDGNSRPLTNISLTEIGTLSVPRIPYVGSAGSKIVFAGGPYINGPYYSVSPAVDIYDVNTKTWSVASLSTAREGIAAISCGNKIFFAGGGYWDMAERTIDIYDVSTNTWSTAGLSEGRSYLTAATVGNKVFFAGGFTDGEEPSSRIDIYDVSTNSWSVAELSQPRDYLTAVTVKDKIYFAGGYARGGYSRQVDIYNNTTQSWSTATLHELSGFISGVTAGDYIYWAGIRQGQNTGQVEIWNTVDGSVSFSCLTYPRYSPGGVVKSNDVVFLASGDWNNEVDFAMHLRNQFDIYNTLTGQWSIGMLPYPVVAPGIISVNNSLYMAGGRTGRQSCTDKVYMLNW